MSAVVCHYGWDEKRIAELSLWVKAGKGRYVVILEKAPAARFLQDPSFRYYAVSLENEEEVFRRIAWEFLFLPFSYEGADFQKLDRIRAEVNFFASDFADQGVSVVKNLMENVRLSAGFGSSLFGTCAKKPAIVCGAGPSLTKSQLRSFAKNALLFAGGSAIDALKRLYLTPHFAAHVDPDPAHKMGGSKAPVFCQLRTSHAVLQGCLGQKLLIPGSGNFPLERWMEEKLKIGTKPFDGGWTVGTFCAALAYALGCDPIIFVGMDLSTMQKSLYAPGVETFSPKEALVPAEGIKGQTVYARIDWLLARSWIEKFAKEHPDRRWINASDGLAFSGMEHCRLSEIDFPKNTVDMLALPQELIDSKALIEEIEASVKRCQEILEKWMQELEAIFPKTESGKTALLWHDLAEEIVFQKALQPIWEIWKPIIARSEQNGAYGLMLSELILYKNVLKEGFGAERYAGRPLS